MIRKFWYWLTLWHITITIWESSMLRRPYTEHCAACSNQTQTARVYPNAGSQEKHEDLTRCFFNVGPALLAVGQYWNSIGSNPRVCWAPHRCLSTPTLPSIIFSPADQGTFSKTAGQSQAYYNTGNWEWGTYDVTHLHILTCEVAVSRAGSVRRPTLGIVIINTTFASIIRKVYFFG